MIVIFVASILESIYEFRHQTIRAKPVNPFEQRMPPARSE
jgi:hypothetical protein